MKYIVSLNGKKYEVEVEQGKATAKFVGNVAAPAADAQQPIAQTAAQPAQSNPTPAVPQGAGEPIKAPMPGTILKVNVASGQQVKAGDVLFILEAMKMENEIVAPHDGQITAVATTTGATVETDAVLATLQ